MPVPPEEHRNDTLPSAELRDEELILYYYGETRNAETIRRHLDASPEAQARYEELCRVLSAVETLPVPETGDGYGRQVWARLRPRLDERLTFGQRLAQWLSPPRLATAGALAAMLALAFLAGRFWDVAEEGLTLTADEREAIMVATVADHLERSQRLLQEISNAPAGARLDVSLERDDADELLGANRLYRQTSVSSGRADLAVVLDELERLLLDLANGPAEIPAEDLEDFRSQIDDILFKVQVLGWRLRGSQQQTAPQGASLVPSRRDGNV